MTVWMARPVVLVRYLDSFPGIKARIIFKNSFHTSNEQFVSGNGAVPDTKIGTNDIVCVERVEPVVEGELRFLRDRQLKMSVATHLDQR